MALLSIKSSKISDGQISLPRTGRWVAVLRATEPVPLDEPLQMEFESGERLAATCVAAGRQGGFWSLSLVGGAGRLDRALRPKYYEGVPAYLIIRDLLTEAGEAAGEIDGPEVFLRYTRLGYPAWQELRRVLLLLPERSWRVQPDGRVWVGREAWPSYPKRLASMEFDFARGHFWFPLEPGLEPGMRLEGRAAGADVVFGDIERVVHHIGQYRTEVFCAR